MSEFFIDAPTEDEAKALRSREPVSPDEIINSPSEMTGEGKKPTGSERLVTDPEELLWAWRQDHRY